MDAVPPTREELERLPLAELLQRAAALGADVSYVHDRNEVIELLANQRRQVLTRYAEELQKFKIRMEGQGQELEIAKKHYQATYDRVEQAVTDRFAQLHDQLLRKEVEVKGHLLYLKNSGDEIITDCSAAMDKELHILEDNLKRCQSRSLDVLDITPATSAVNVTVPSIAGRGFDFADITSLDLSSLRITLDLHASSKLLQMDPPQVPASRAPPQHLSAAPPRPPSPSHHPTSYPPPAQPPSTYGHHSGMPPHDASQNSFRVDPYAHPTQQPSLGATGTDLLTFPADHEIDMKYERGGLRLYMIPSAKSDVIGAQAHEVFTKGIHTWKVRLDNIQESLLGMVDSRDQSESGAGEGFFWSPIRRDVHGKRGKASQSLIMQIPVAQPGDTIKMTYDADAGTLRVAHNGMDYGLLCSELFGMLSPFFVFARGEGLTVLQ